MKISSILLCILTLVFCSTNGFGQDGEMVSPDGPAVAIDWNEEEASLTIVEPGYAQQVSLRMQTEDEEEELVLPEVEADSPQPTDVIVSTDADDEEEDDTNKRQQPPRQRYDRYGRPIRSN